jgi:hypothetical protein
VKGDINMVNVNNSGKTVAYLPKGKGGYVTFKPGINEIDPKDFESVIKTQKDRAKKDGIDKWEHHYSKYLTVVKSVPVSAKTPKPKDSVIPEKTVNELKAVIDGMSESELEVLENTENERDGGPRKTVIKMIEEARENLVDDDSDNE